MLNLRDLDFENNGKSLRENMANRDSDDALRDIRATRQTLGKFTVRDTMEAVYGEAYTRQLMGEEGGKDILMEELSPSEDIREAAGGKRRDIGSNRLPDRKLDDMSSSERNDLRNALTEQEQHVDAELAKSEENFRAADVKAFRAQKVVEDLNQMLPEDRDEIIRLLQAQARKESK